MRTALFVIACLLLSVVFFNFEEVESALEGFLTTRLHELKLYHLVLLVWFHAVLRSKR